MAFAPKKKKMKYYLKEEVLKVLMKKIIGDLAACHANGVIHRDIKFGNLLVHIPKLEEWDDPEDEDREDYLDNFDFKTMADDFHVKIADLGLSKAIELGE